MHGSPSTSRRELAWIFEGSAPRIGNDSDPQAYLTRSTQRLRAFGVRTVVLQRAHLDGTPWQARATRSLRGLGIRRAVGDDLVVYDLRPGGG